VLPRTATRAVGLGGSDPKNCPQLQTKENGWRERTYSTRSHGGGCTHGMERLDAFVMHVGGPYGSSCVMFATPPTFG